MGVAVGGGEGGGEGGAGEGFFVAGDLLGCALSDDVAAAGAAFGAEVDEPVGLFDDVEMVLDDDDGVAEVDETIEDIHQFANVVEMKAGGGLVENVECAAGLAA